MSAAQLIELFDALPAQEQKIVVEHIIKAADAQQPETKPKADFKDLVNQVFDKHSHLMERLAQ